MANIHRHRCVYCGASAQSRDHVPPKAWFAREVSIQIRVPSCNACNLGRSMRDEEFRVILGLLVGLKTPTQRRLWKRARRTLDHSPKLRRQFALNVIRDDSTGQAGVSVPKIVIDDALTRVVRGLHWHHYKEAINQSTAMEVWQITRDGYEATRNMLLTDLNSGHVGFDQFQYLHGRVIDRPKTSLWLLALYRRIYFSVMTGYPREGTSE